MHPHFSSPFSALACALVFAPAFGPSLQDPEAVDFATLSGFEYEEGKELPKDVRKLHKQKITLSGFMRREEPGSEPVEFFMLINDACGCNGLPMLNEVVFAAMPEGVTTKVSEAIVEVTGTLYVEVVKEDGYTVALYQMDVDKVTFP